MPTIKVLRKIGGWGGNQTKPVTTIKRVVWATHPGFAEETGDGVSGVWSKHTQHWCMFDGERRLLTRKDGEWTLIIHSTHMPKKQVLF